MSGSLTSLNIFNLITGSANFAISTSTITLPLNDSTPDLSGATLVTVGLSNLSLQVGSGGLGLMLTGGSLGLAAITPGPIPAGTTATDNREWIAVNGSIQTVSLNLGANILASASNVTVQINQATGAFTMGGTVKPAAALDWTAFSPAIDPGANLSPSVSMPITFTAALLQVQASVVLSIESYVFISGNVSFTKTGPLFVTPVGSSSTVAVNALEIGASNVYVFVGIGGPYWIMNPDGTVSAPNASQSAGALGLALANISLGLALLTPTTAGGASYYALKASGSAQLVGIAGLTLGGSLEVDVNRSSVATSPPIDFTKLAGNSLAIPTGPGASPVSLDFSGSLLRASGSVTLAVSQFAYLSGNFDFEKGAAQTVTLQDGTQQAVSSLEVGVSNVYAFAGANGPYWVMNPNGTIRGPTSGESAGALGVAISNASLGLALLKPIPTTANPAPSISYLALKASGSVSFVGITGLTLSANNLTVEINQASDSANASATVPTVNLTASPLAIPTDSNPADNVALNFATGPILAAQGTVSLAISQFAYVTGTFTFTKGGTQAVTLSNGTQKTVSVLTVGASGVYGFAGVGGPYWVTNANGSITAPTSSTAVGVALSGVSFGLALLKTSDGSASYYSLKANASGVALVGVPGVSLSATGLSLDVNGSGGAAGSPVVNFSRSYPATSGLVISTGPTTSILLNDAAASLQASGMVTLALGAAGQPTISLGAFVTFEDTTDANGSQVIELSLQGVGFSFGSPALFSVSGGSGLFVIEGSTLAGEIGVPLVITNSTVAFSGMINLEFNSGSDPVNATFTDAATGASQSLALPSGPYFRLAGDNLTLTLTVGQGNPVALKGSLQFDEITMPAANGLPSYTAVRIAAYNVGLSFTDPTYGGVTLSNGQGAFIFLTGGVAGQLSGNFQGNLPAVSAGGQVSLEINTTNAAVNQTIPLDSGGTLQVNVPANTFALGISNASINIDNIVTLTGNFQVTTMPGMVLYGASNVTLFLGAGPLTINGAANPNAIGIEVTNASLGVVKFTATGKYAVFAYGQAALVGLSPLSISGSIAVWVNETGQAVDVTVPLPAGSSPASVPVTFQSPAFIKEFAAGYAANGSVDPTQLLTISASQVFTIQGAIQFTLSPTGAVNVNVPTASVNINIPDSSGNFSSTPTFSIKGSAQFSIGGGQGFQLQGLQVNGFSIFGVGATIQTPSTSLRPPTATLSYPSAGQAVDVNQLNKQGYILVHYNDVNNVGINVQAILNGSGQFTLSGAAASGVQVNSRPTQVSPNDDSDFEYSFQGSFDASVANPTVTVMFTPGSYGDNRGATNVAQYATFSLFDSTKTAASQTITPGGSPTGGSYVLGVTRPDTGAAGTITVPLADTQGQIQALFDAFYGAGNTVVTDVNNALTVKFVSALAQQTVPVFTVNSSSLTGGSSPGVAVVGNLLPATGSLTSPVDGSTVNTQSLDQRGYIDVTFNVPGGGIIVPPSTTSTANTAALTGAITIGGPAAALVKLAGVPTLVSGNTYRYSLVAISNTTPQNQLFAAGLFMVNFSPNAMSPTVFQVQVPQGAGSTATATTSITLMASTQVFTVSGTATDEGAASNAISLGPLSLAGPSIGLAGESFKGGTLNLTVAIGVASAGLGFGASQSGSGITAALTNVLGTFNVQVNLLTLIPALLSKNVSSILAHSACPGASAWAWAG